MKLFTELFKRENRLSGKRLVATTGAFVALTLAGMTGASMLSNSQVAAGDCSGNSIIICGAQSRTDFINDIKKSPELQKIYADPRFGSFTAADYSRFISSAKNGLAYRDNNTIVVDGKVVATDVGSIGRWASYQGSGYRTFVIKGAGTYYGNLNQKSISPNSPSLPVEVLFNSQGKMQFAVMMSSCANPTYGTPTTPPTCQDLHATKIGTNQYEFTTSITAGSDKETVNKVVYNFGDGTTVTATTAPYTVRHSFTKSATVTATVYTNVPGGGTAVSSTCETKITYVALPQAACVALSALPIDRTDFALNASAKAANGATISSYAFSVADGNGKVVANPVVSTTAETASAKVFLTTPGIYSAKVTVQTSLGALTSPTCVTPLTVTPPTPKSPDIAITKHVDNQKQEQVDLGQNFTYELVVTNTGQIDLTNVAVTDPAPTGVTMVSSDLGAINDNAWSYTIPSLAVGQSVTVNITAVVNGYVAGDLVNTACVNAPQVNPSQPAQPDACDTATVTVTPPSQPPVMPNTGAGNVIGIVVGAVVAGTVAGRLFLTRRLTRPIE